MAPDLPTGTVTFLFTDIEGSTVRWERAPEQMTQALAQHDAVLRRAIDQCSGVLCQTAGDSFVVGFESAPDALLMALSVQRALRAEDWPAETGPLRVRMALHTGTATQRGDTYDANHTLTRQSRIVAIADAEQILVSGTTHALLIDHLPDAVELRDLGQLWLKDLLEPVHVYRVIAPSEPWLLPEVEGAEDPGPGSMPAFSVPFIGREVAVDDVSSSVADPARRLTTLVGPGGMGKTRLAIRAAQCVQHHFAGGVVFADLSAVTDAAFALPAIAVALDSSETSLESVADLLDEHDCLLVLDNLEQVVGISSLVDELLAKTRAPRILATSRIPLGLVGERVYEVAPLGLPDLTLDDSMLTRAASSFEAMALFVERATAAEPTFVLTDENARSIAEMCHRLDGIPLALVLAAARSRILTPSMMLERLDRRLALLTRGPSELPARHQTLRDTIDWSYDLLDEREKLQYARWSVFVGGFRLEAAHACAGDEDDYATIDGLSTLVECSLLTASPTADGAMRYRMLETINEHARDQLRSIGDVDDTAVRHARHFCSLAEEAAPHLEDEQLAHWSARLEEDHDNLRAALLDSFSRTDAGDDAAAETAVRLAAALALFWHDRGHLTEGRRHLEAAVAVCQTWEAAAVDDDARQQAIGTAARILDYLGSMARRRGDLASAHRHLDAALDAHERIDDRRGRGRVLAAVGSLLRQENDMEGARSVIEQCLELALSVGDAFTAVDGYLTLGNIERDVGNPDGALPLYAQALDTARSINEFVGMSVALNNAANIAIQHGDLERACELHLESLELRHSIRHRIMVAESIVGLAAVAAAGPRKIVAAELLAFANQLADDVGAAFDPEEQRLHDRTRAVLADELSEPDLEAAHRAGSSWSLDAAVDLARSIRVEA